MVQQSKEAEYREEKGALLGKGGPAKVDGMVYQQVPQTAYQGAHGQHHH